EGPFTAHLTTISVKKGLNVSLPLNCKYWSNKATRSPVSRSTYFLLLILMEPIIVHIMHSCISRFSQRLISRYTPCHDYTHLITEYSHHYMFCNFPVNNVIKINHIY